jgi:cell division septal protein FtsQ
MGTNERRRKTVKKPEKKPAQEVVYLPPKPFNRNRLLLHLATVAAVVIALVIGITLFFKVDSDKILVSGNAQYSEWDIVQASGLKDGENLLTFNRSAAAARIRLELDYVESVRFGIKLPDTVLIEVNEIEVTYAVKDTKDDWWLISSGGKVVGPAEEEEGRKEPGKVLGIRIADPKVGHPAVADKDQPATDENGNPIPVIHTNAQRLTTALDILQYLELNGILGDAASVDVNNMGDIQLWYKDQYQVKLGDNSQMGYKISMMAQMIAQMDDYQSGVLDLSFTTYPDKGGYRPFE